MLISVLVTVEEKISVSAIRDGGIRSVEINGVMNLNISNPDYSKIRLQVEHKQDPEFQFKVIII